MASEKETKTAPIEMKTVVRKKKVKTISNEKKTKTVFVANIPKTVRVQDLETHFANCGSLLKCFLVRDPAGTAEDAHRGLGYVTFSSADEAAAACKTYNGKNFHGKDLTVRIALPKPADDEKPKPVLKGSDQGYINKKARLIIRNLAFTADEEVLKEQFSKFGEVKEVNMLKKKDGRKVGVAFIQYDKVAEAKEAIKEMNKKKVCNRAVAVDWAVPKQQYKEIQNQKQAAEESESDEEIESEDEDDSSDDEDDTVKEKQSSKRKRVEEEASDTSDDSDSEDDSESDADKESKDESSKHSEMGQKKHGPITADYKSRDVVEKRTVFVRNVPFSASGDDVKELMLQFGDVKYAVLCIDKLTEHPKGTAFVQFLSSEAAEACITAGSYDAQPGLKLQSNKIICAEAISRADVSKTAEDRKTHKPKDLRNLYLAREGWISAQSAAGEGVSKHDLAKRVKLEQYKRQALKNCLMFVSRTRMCVHNIPFNWSDGKLRKLFQKYGGQGRKIKECRVMRDLNQIDTKTGVGLSRGYGFVEFTEHEHSLAALRKINNNPDIFTDQKRPIVEFSVENSQALKAKQKRMEKSKLMNEDFRPGAAKRYRRDKFGRKKKLEIEGNEEATNSTQGVAAGAKPERHRDRESFTGRISNPEIRLIPGRKLGKKDMVPKGKGKITRKMLKNESKPGRNKKFHNKMNKALDNQILDTRPPKVKEKKFLKPKFKGDDKEFTNLVNNYKKKLMVASTEKKKWFTE